MRGQTRRYTDNYSCLTLLFLARIRTGLERAAPGSQVHTNTRCDTVSVTRLAGGYAMTSGGRTQPLKLTTTRTGYGVRYWYCCPWCDRRCAVLYVTPRRVACRQCCGLHYASQNESTQERMIRSVRRRRLALWGRSEPLSALSLLPMSPYLFLKPPRMHWQTFEARRDAVVDYELHFRQVEKAILARRFPERFC